jgi:hypothetical protein
MLSGASEVEFVICGRSCIQITNYHYYSEQHRQQQSFGPPIIAYLVPVRVPQLSLVLLLLLRARYVASTSTSTNTITSSFVVEDVEDAHPQHEHYHPQHEDGAVEVSISRIPGSYHNKQ